MVIYVIFYMGFSQQQWWFDGFWIKGFSGMWWKIPYYYSIYKFGGSVRRETPCELNVFFLKNGQVLCDYPPGITQSYGNGRWEMFGAFPVAMRQKWWTTINGELDINGNHPER